MKSTLLTLFPFILSALASPINDDKYPIKTVTTTRTTTTTTTAKTTSTTVTTKTVTTTGSSATQSFYVNYNFETVGNGDVDPVALETIDEYDLLYFEYINLVDDTASQLNISTVTGGTAPNAAVFGPTLLADPLALSNPPAQITTQYTESVIQSFTPYSWYYGCLLSTVESEASVPVACTITANGYNSNGALVGTQAFPFVPSGLLTSPLTFAYFNGGFANVQYMNLTVTNNATVAAIFDDFIAELHQITSAVFYPHSAPIPAN